MDKIPFPFRLHSSVRLLPYRCLLLACWIVALPVCLHASVAFKPEIGLGADYSNQRYSAFSADTLSSVTDTLNVETEGRTRFGVSLNVTNPANRFDAVNNLHISTLSFRDLLNLDFEQNLGSAFKLQTSYDGEVRYYHHAFPQLSDTTYRRNYLNNAAGAVVKYKPNDNLDLSLGDALEDVHYPQPDIYSYDYLLNRARLELNVNPSLFSSLDAEYILSRRWAAGADSENYTDNTLEADFSGYPGSRWRTRLANDIGRRRYQSRERSYWEENPDGLLGFDISDKFALSLEDNARLTRYDSASYVYHSQTENTLRFLGEFRPSLEWTIRAGPQLDAVRSWGRAQPEDYSETSVILGLEYFAPGGLMLSFEDRFGTRKHPLADSSYQTDYRLNDLSLSVDWTILKLAGSALAFDGYLNLAPEWHTDPIDNLSSNTFTAELKYRF